MASGFIYRCWTNNNRGSSGNFLFFVSVTLALMVMFMVTKASAFVATVTAVQPGNNKMLVEEETIKQSKTIKTNKIRKSAHKHKTHVARSKSKRRWKAPTVAHFDGHSLGSKTAQVTAEGVGVASWYGPGFHGRRTASGTVYDMNEMTAAHKTLPFGTKLLVTNKATGKSTIVTITDRGPFIGKRVLDLSKEAARQLHMIRSGIGEVEYKIL